MFGVADFHELNADRVVVQLTAGLWLVNSDGGWMVAGKGVIKQPSPTVYSNKVFACPALVDVDRFWNLEVMGIRSSIECDISDEEIAMSQFKSTIRSLPDGRHSVSWPRKSAKSHMSNNFGLCLGRLQSTLKGLASKPQLLEQYFSSILLQLQS